MSYLSKIRTAAVVLAAGAVGGGFAASSALADGGNVPDTKAQQAAVSAAAAPVEDRRFAVVSQAGALVRDRNAISALRLAVGRYQVVFERDIRFCAYVGSLGQTGAGTPQDGEIAVASRAGNANGVFVQTRSTNGALADRSFHLVVVC